MNLREFFENYWSPAAIMLADVQRQGECLDVPRTRATLKRWEDRHVGYAEALKAEGQKLGFADLKLGQNATTDDVRRLVQQLGVEPVETETGKTAVNDLALAPHRKDVPAADLILRFRQAGTMIGFLKSWLEHVGSDGRLHPRSKQAHMHTLRIAQEEPNLNQVPRRAHDKETQAAIMELRRCFVPHGPNDMILQADEVALEFALAGGAADRGNDATIIAGLSKEPPENFHKKLTALAFAMPEARVEKGSRHYDVGKSGNFQMTYGGSANGFRLYMAKEGVVLAQKVCDAVKRAHERLYPGLYEWHARAEKDWRAADGWVENHFGYRLRIPIPEDERSWIYANAVHRAINNMNQSDATIINTIFALLGWRVLVGECGPRASYPGGRVRPVRNLRSRLVNLIHDARKWNVAPGEEAQVLALDRAISHKVAWPWLDWLRVPLRTDYERGPTWGDMEPVKIAP